MNEARPRRRWRTVAAAVALCFAGFCSGSVLMYLHMDWRIGAVEAFANVAMLNAVVADQQLTDCRRRTGARWPRNRMEPGGPPGGTTFDESQALQ